MPIKKPKMSSKAKSPQNQYLGCGSRSHSNRDNNSPAPGRCTRHALNLITFVKLCIIMKQRQQTETGGQPKLLASLKQSASLSAAERKKKLKATICLQCADNSTLQNKNHARKSANHH